MDFHNVAPDFVKYFDVEEKSMPATGYAYINEANFLRPRAIKVILQVIASQFLVFTFCLFPKKIERKEMKMVFVQLIS